MLNDNSVKEYSESVPGHGLMSRYCYESLDTDTISDYISEHI